MPIHTNSLPAMLTSCQIMAATDVTRGVKVLIYDVAQNCQSFTYYAYTIHGIIWSIKKKNLIFESIRGTLMEKEQK